MGGSRIQHPDGHDDLEIDNVTNGADDRLVGNGPLPGVGPLEETAGHR